MSRAHAAAVDLLLQKVATLRGSTLLDPCCGDGQLSLQVLQAERFQRAQLNDLDPSAPAATFLDAAVAGSGRSWGPVDCSTGRAFFSMRIRRQRSKGFLRLR